MDLKIIHETVDGKWTFREPRPDAVFIKFSYDGRSRSGELGERVTDRSLKKQLSRDEGDRVP